jgi:hypothetical protein
MNYNIKTMVLIIFLLPLAACCMDQAKYQSDVEAKITTEKKLLDLLIAEVACAKKHEKNQLTQDKVDVHELEQDKAAVEGKITQLQDCLKKLREPVVNAMQNDRRSLPISCRLESKKNDIGRNKVAPLEKIVLVVA